MELIAVKSLPARIQKVKKILQSAGNTIGAVTFKKRSDGTKRKMAYRLHVRKPTYARKPNGGKVHARKTKDEDNLQLTVFDVNKVLRNKKGRISGRGAYRVIPLENVVRICVKGKKYKIISN